MSWLVDNATSIYLLLGVIAVGFVALFWLNKRVKFLAFAGGVLALIGLVWLAAHYFDSDSKQLKQNVEAMADAVKDGKVDDLFTHVSKDFRYKELDRDALHQRAQLVMEWNDIGNVQISAFRVEELSRAKKFARTWFRVSAWAKGGGDPYLFVTQADFVLEGDQWKLKTMRFYNPVVDHDKEIDIPGLR